MLMPGKNYLEPAGDHINKAGRKRYAWKDVPLTLPYLFSDNNFPPTL